MEKFQQGDENAFDELVKKYHDKIYRLCYYFTHNAGDALDLTQEIFIRVFQTLGDFKGQSNFFTWLYRIAQNLCIDYTRRKKVYLNAELVYSEDALNKVEQSSPCKLLEVKELEDEVAKALDMLSSRTKTMVILRYYEGLDYKSISEILGCRVGAVKANLSSGMRMLRKTLSPYLNGELIDYKESVY